jgi:hypothetical protein
MGACSECPTAAATGFDCTGAQCVARTCLEGYSLQPDERGHNRCVASGWSTEVLERNHREGGPNSRLVVDASGNVHVAYIVGETIVHATRTAAGWSHRRIPAPGPPPLDLFLSAFQLDARGNAHFIYFARLRLSEGTQWTRYVRVKPDGTPEMDRELGESDPSHFALATDAEGDAHVVYLSGRTTYYRRTFRGSWSPPQPIAASIGPCAIALDGAGDIHLGCAFVDLNHSDLSYVRGSNSIFSILSRTRMPYRQGNFSLFERQMHLRQDGAHEFWFRDRRGYLVATVNNGVLGPPVTWGPPDATPRFLFGTRGASEFVALEQRSVLGMLALRRGPPSGPTSSRDIHLPIQYLLDGFAIDPSGGVHALARQITSNPRIADLVYIRGR